MSDYLKQVQKKLNLVSPSFCLAKWTSVTLHLESGTTHSCHHTKVHDVPLGELKHNPSALHNTSYKIEQRKKMIKGERPSECSYCWQVEDLKTNQISDRILKSGYEWSIGQLSEVVSYPYALKFKPKYVEVSFSNKCQFKCSYCSGNFSSAWEEEIKQYGPYTTNSGVKDLNMIKEDENPYIEAFWQWWPELKKDLLTFRITGGEPLLSPNTFKVIENLLINPEPNLILAINTNLGAPPVLIEKFITLVNKTLEAKAVKQIKIYTSIDTYGERAEYIRNGLNHAVFWSNVEKLLKVNEAVKMGLMCTFNALSISSFTDLLKKILDLNTQYKNSNRFIPIELDISYLQNPPYQSVQVLSEEFVFEMSKIVEFIEKNLGSKYSNQAVFNENQHLKSKRILEIMKNGIDPDRQKQLRKEFFQFFSEHDLRRNTNFLKTFPEMENFWKLCEGAANE